jgi:hypothetical protein
MSKITFAMAILGATIGFSELGTADTLMRADCRPLTPENLRACCAADNWRDLIRSGDEAFCNADEFGQPLAATPQATATPGVPGTPTPGAPGAPGTTPDQTASVGNPGNEPGINGPDSEVGKAGENPDHDTGGGFGDSEAQGNSQ